HRRGRRVYVRVAARGAGLAGYPDSGQGTGGVSIMRILAAFVLASVAAGAQSPRGIPVMLLDGESGGRYHDWQHVTPALKKMLDETGLFTVTVVTAPATTGELTGFDPHFANYRAVVM